MKYKNIKTGAIIDSTFKLLGKNWVEVTDEKEGIQKTTETVEEEYVEEEIDLEAMTNNQLEDFAKKHDIKLTTEDKKNKDTRIAAIVKAFE